MKETCHQFGEHRTLAGILTMPAHPQRIGCVLVNAGLVPKAGPYRLYVQLARRLARDGVMTLRFDLGGIGDSRQLHAGEPLRARSAREVKAAVDELARHEVDHIVVAGLCSGAEDAFRYAEHDPRVHGVVMIDPFSYRTTGYVWRSLVHRASRRILRAAGLYEPVMPAVGQPRVVSYQYMERPESSRILRAMIARKAHVHFVYTGGQQDSFNHEHQLAAMFDDIAFEGRVSVDYFPEMDHTQLLDGDRRTVVNAIGTRLIAAYR